MHIGLCKEIISYLPLQDVIKIMHGSQILCESAQLLFENRIYPAPNAKKISWENNALVTDPARFIPSRSDCSQKIYSDTIYELILSSDELKSPEHQLSRCNTVRSLVLYSADLLDIFTSPFSSAKQLLTNVYRLEIQNLYARNIFCNYDLSQLTNLHTLDLCDVSLLAKLKITNMKYLHTLIIDDYSIPPVQIDLRGLHNLTNLTLRDIDVSFLAINVNSKIERLEIVNIVVTERKFHEILMATTAIKELVLQICYVEDGPLNLDTISHMKNVKQISITVLSDHDPEWIFCEDNLHRYPITVFYD